MGNGAQRAVGLLPVPLRLRLRVPVAEEPLHGGVRLGHERGVRLPGDLEVAAEVAEGDRVVVDGVVKLSLMPPGAPVQLSDGPPPPDGKGTPAAKTPAADKKT